MMLPNWVPQVSRPWNPAYRDVWAAMSPNERRWSFIFDIFVCLPALCVVVAVLLGKL